MTYVDKSALPVGLAFPTITDDMLDQIVMDMEGTPSPYAECQLEGFPPVHAFVPSEQSLSPITPQTQPSLAYDNAHNYTQHAEYMQNTSSNKGYHSYDADSLQSLSPSSVLGAWSMEPQPLENVQLTHLPLFEEHERQRKLREPGEHRDLDNHQIRCKVTRGISSGGSATKPPRIMTLPGHHYAPVDLDLVCATLDVLCLPRWSDAEKADGRRIIRIERHQVGARIVAQFSIVGAANEHGHPMPAAPGVDFAEVSCLRCYVHEGEDEDEELTPQPTNRSPIVREQFYITSVEVVRVVELLIGTELKDAHERRRERGRIRSNLVPFWSKRSICSRLSTQCEDSPKRDFRAELATRIMAYETRRPRDFDKEVRILQWAKLVPALQRALQSYYAEVPMDF